MSSTSTIRAELVEHKCVALGMTTQGVQARCRLLLDVGHHPLTGLDIYSGNRLVQRIGEIGQAQLSDRIIIASGDWAVASDGIQWILCKARKGASPWYGVSFVRSTKEILARCMREKGTPPDDATRLLAGLPDCFDEWLRLPAQPEQPAKLPAWQVPPGAGRSRFQPETVRAG
jgi:hypothetical protein